MPSSSWIPSSPGTRLLPARVRTRVALVVVTACATVASGMLNAPSTPTAAPAPRAASPAPAALAPVQLAAVKKSIAPSGKAMPLGSTKTWKQIFRDDFTGSKLKKPWTKYSGQPGGNPAGYWKPSHTVVSGGALHLKTYKENGRWVSGGVGAWNGLAMKYGRVDVRFRAPQAKGVSYALLLWPQDGGWPPEIDFAEDGGHDRKSTAATFHHGAANKQIQRHKSANFAKWHTVGVQWSPNKIVYTLDGKAWATVKHSAVPQTKMVLAMQSHAMSCGIAWATCPSAATPKRSSIDIDWVTAYQRR